MPTKLYPDSHVELTPFTARHYDALLHYGTFGIYTRFLSRAIRQMNIRPGERILDLGCGTGKNAKLMCDSSGGDLHVTGLDVSEHMERQFRRTFRDDPRGEFTRQRIDVTFDLHQLYDKALISFVLHGFPHDVRPVIIRNAFNHLEPGGVFLVLDFAEFDIHAIPFLHRFILKAVECKYAFDFIKRDWKLILQEHKFDTFTEQFFLRNYVRLLAARKHA